MASVRSRDRLIAHREREDANSKLLIQGHIETHSLKEVSRAVIKVIEHIVRQLCNPGLGSKSDRLRIRLLDAEMVERNPQWLQRNARKLLQVDRIFAENAGIDTLIEVHPALPLVAFAVECRPALKAKINDFRDDVLKFDGSDDIVIHQDQVALLTVETIDTLNDLAQRVYVTLTTFKFLDPQNAHFLTQPRGGVGEVGIRYRVLILDVVQNAVIGHQILDGLAVYIIRVNLFFEWVQA